MSAGQTVDRLLDTFEGERQTRRGRVLATEILVGSNAVASLIREKKTFQLGSVIQTGKREGMQAMDESITSLVREHVITPEEAALHLSNRDLIPVGGTTAGPAAAHPTRPAQS